MPVRADAPAADPSSRRAPATILGRAMERCHVLWSGRVQGVGFRWRATRCAAGRAVTGWVRNLPDGRVELVAEGERAEVEGLLASIRSEMDGLIDGERATWGTPEGGLDGFRILGTGLES